VGSLRGCAKPLTDSVGGESGDAEDQLWEP